MKASTFQDCVMRTANSGLDNHQALTNVCMGIAGEAGEFVDIIKKALFHGHTLDLAKAKNELGDILFYVAWAADALDLNLDDVMEGNVAKLLKRYPNGFNSADSIKRVDVK
jgi:NTP pyrophosphatase (non-canonical NTP hydrolase)